MKTVIINEQQQERLKLLTENITVFSFIHHVKDYLKKLLNDPVYAKPNEFLIVNGLDGETLKKYLEDANLLIKKERIETVNGKDKFRISYTVSTENGEKKLRRLYSKLFEKNIVEGTILSEEGEGGCIGGEGISPAGTPANNCNASAPINKLGNEPMRRKTVYISQKQYDKLQEEAVMDTAIGDFGYDAPPFKKKKDPAYNHKDMMKKSFNNE